VCEPDGIDSAYYMSVLLPRLNYLKIARKSDVQAFCYYNFPDKDEEEIVENHLNGLAPGLFVKCFGNFIDECCSAAIHGMAMDTVAQLVHAKYNGCITELDKPLDSQCIKSEWEKAGEVDKISSRQAGDHFWTKLRLDNEVLGWAKKHTKESLNTEKQLWLSEVEHRRWCADHLMQGFVPFEVDTGSDKYKTLVKRWRDKPYKERNKKMRYHIDLVPFEGLTPEESGKDKEQIDAIPYYYKYLVK